MIKDKKGITLIALVITIIVLLILAGVSISMITGDDGIATQASNASEKTRGGKIKEQVALILEENKIANYQGDDLMTKDEVIEKLVEQDLLTEEEIAKLDNLDIITVGGITIDFSDLEDDGFDYLGRKYLLGSWGYTIFNEGADMTLYDYENNILGQIPAACMTYNEKLVTISGTGDYDGSYKISDDDHYVLKIEEDGDEYLLGIEDGYCTHTKNNNLIGITDEITYWRGFYDENHNSVAFWKIENISEFDNYTLRCEICHTELDFMRDGNYLYLYNSNMEPQIINGEQITGKCVDIWDEDINGWTAVPFDSAETEGLLTSINGEPIKILYFYNNMYVPKTTQCISTIGTEFAVEENKEPTEYLITYEGTIAQFNQITDWTSSKNKFVDIIKSRCNSDDTILSFVVKCQDGDLVIK